LLSATVREDGYELSLTVNFALRSGTSMTDASTSYSGLPTGSAREAFSSQKGGRRSSLTRYASQESLGKFYIHAYIHYLLKCTSAYMWYIEQDSKAQQVALTTALNNAVMKRVCFVLFVKLKSPFRFVTLLIGW